MGSSYPAQHTTGASRKVEGDILEFPFFFLGKRSPPKETTHVFDEEVDADRVTRKVTLLNARGVPGALGQDCFVAQDGKTIKHANKGG